MKGNSQSSNNPSIGKGKKGQSRMEMKEGNKDPNDRKGNQMERVGSESSDGPDECWIEHGCDMAKG